MNEIEPIESNLFGFFRRGVGTENAFSAGLAYLLASEPEAQRVFLEFIAQQTGVSIDHKDGWEVRTEVERSATGQPIYVDLVLSRATPIPTELWFEHKIESGLGDGQLERYLEAVTRSARQGELVVQLAFISRRRLDLSGALAAKLQSAGGSGVRWCEAEGGNRGFISWPDMLPVMQQACADWDRTNRMFIEWWSRLPNMVAPDSASSWSDLIPKQEGGQGAFQETRLGQLWYAEQQCASEGGWELVAKPYKGNPHTFRRGGVKIQVTAFDSHEAASKRSGINLSDMRAELLEVALFGEEVQAHPEERAVDEVRGGRRWSLKTTYDKKTGTWIRVMVEVGEMADVDFSNDGEIARLLAETFSVGMDVLRSRQPQHFAEPPVSGN